MPIRRDLVSIAAWVDECFCAGYRRCWTPPDLEQEQESEATEWKREDNRKREGMEGTTSYSWQQAGGRRFAAHALHNFRK